MKRVLFVLAAMLIFFALPASITRAEKMECLGIVKDVAEKLKERNQSISEKAWSEICLNKLTKVGKNEANIAIAEAKNCPEKSWVFYHDLLGTDGKAVGYLIAIPVKKQKGLFQFFRLEFASATSQTQEPVEQPDTPATKEATPLSAVPSPPSGTITQDQLNSLVGNATSTIQASSSSAEASTLPDNSPLIILRQLLLEKLVNHPEIDKMLDGTKDSDDLIVAHVWEDPRRGQGLIGVGFTYAQKGERLREGLDASFIFNGDKLRSFYYPWKSLQIARAQIIDVEYVYVETITTNTSDSLVNHKENRRARLEEVYLPYSFEKNNPTLVLRGKKAFDKPQVDLCSDGVQFISKNHPKELAILKAWQVLVCATKK